jgi:hypothetical protein
MLAITRGFEEVTGGDLKWVKIMDVELLS